jgi:hypothetical protein
VRLTERRVLHLRRCCQRERAGESMRYGGGLD